MNNQHTPLISIILPTYNGSKFLRQSLDSCINQTYPHWELIIVDDCSTDDTPAIITEYAQQETRIRAIRHETNRGIAGGLNTGFANAKGDYLTWTSDDNLYYPNALEEMVAILNTHPHIGVVYADMRHIDDDGNFIRDIIHLDSDELAIRCVIGACFLYRRTVYETIGDYDEQLKLSQDYDFWLRVAMKFKYYHLNEFLYDYRLHAKAMTAQYQDSVVRIGELTTLAYLPRMTWLTDDQIMRAYGVLVKRAVTQRDWQRIVLYSTTMMRHHPRLLVQKILKTAKLTR